MLHFSNKEFQTLFGSLIQLMKFLALLLSRLIQMYRMCMNLSLTAWTFNTETFHPTQILQLSIQKTPKRVMTLLAKRLSKKRSIPRLRPQRISNNKFKKKEWETLMIKRANKKKIPNRIRLFINHAWCSLRYGKLQIMCSIKWLHLSVKRLRKLEMSHLILWWGLTLRKTANRETSLEKMAFFTMELAIFMKFSQDFA